MTTETNNSKKIIYSMGGKGGGGKTTAMVSIADFFQARKVPVTLVDSDTENVARGSLSYRQTTKVNIRSQRGLDDFVDLVLGDSTPLVLADLGAGSGQDTFKWFDDMHEPLKEAGIKFLAVGVVTGDSATTETVLRWASALKNRTEYLIIRNHRDGDDFGYLENTEPGQRFLKAAKPALIDMEARASDIQRELDNRGLSLDQALKASAESAGPLLSKASVKIRMRGYLARIENQLGKVIDTLLP
jgi:CobQ/CobB/MinD/ParA family nucleotide binding protein